MMKKITAAVLGAGLRGRDAYASYGLKHPDEIEFVAVAEIDEKRRNIFKELHNIKDENVFDTWEDLLEKDRLADCIFICTQDRMHYEPAMQALEKGYHVLLEKPMSPDPEECIKMGEMAKKCNRAFTICHVLRYTKFFSTIKKIIDSGRIGRLMTIMHNEYVGYIHQSHSFVRGNWRNSEETSPMILAKSCHDMDILLYLVGADCTKISSFGKLSTFKEENAPEGAPLRCLDGCPAAKTCQYNVHKIYLTENTDWPTSAITEDLSFEGRYKALKEGPYGRCVYHCDNDVVDHQVVNMEFANEVTASFTMTAFSRQNRTIKVMGTEGFIRGNMDKNVIEVHDVINNTVESIDLGESLEGHGGGDYGLMEDFIDIVRNDGKSSSKSSADLSVQSHLMSFAAEKSRLEGKIIDIEEFTKSITNNL